MDDTRRTILVTGGAGFIGGALVRCLIERTAHRVINVDKLTYAGNLESQAEAGRSVRHVFVHADICDRDAMRHVFDTHHPNAVVHLAAESHVDRSIDDPGAFVQTNLVGTFELLEAVRRHRDRLPSQEADAFRFLHVSTDEVFGDLGCDGFFSESSPYAPSSPYSATKAGSDHLVRAWGRTYGIPVLITNCSNNYGPYQFPEKLIPHVILNALAGKPLPVYGDGQQVRDWIYVDDHVRALMTVLEDGVPGETYTIGGDTTRTNLQVVEAVCETLDALSPAVSHTIQRYADLITFVADRPGHDRRYAIDASLIDRRLGWQPAESFASGLERTVRWYLENRAWWERVLDGSYRMERAGRALGVVS